MIKKYALIPCALLLAACVQPEPTVIHTETHEVIETVHPPVIYEEEYSYPVYYTADCDDYYC